jgi:two-component system, cell cycle sensor histidine kinase and response regulator CckA
MAGWLPGGHVQLLIDYVVGNEVAARATAARPGLPVLYMSGYAQPVLDTQGALGPGVDLLEKPFSESDLLTRVRHAIDEADQPPETGPGHVR